MRRESNLLLSELVDQVNQQIIFTKENLKPLNFQLLKDRPSPDHWGIAECLEHLNLYGDYYLPEIEKRIHKAKPVNDDYIYKSGWLGNYFAESMLPKDGRIKNKMKTFKNKNPAYLSVPENVVNRFLTQQEKLIQLLEQSKSIHLNKIWVPVSIAKMIRLNLGDTFRFFINHQIRHFHQIENVLKQIKL